MRFGQRVSDAIKEKLSNAQKKKWRERKHNLLVDKSGRRSIMGWNPIRKTDNICPECRKHLTEDRGDYLILEHLVDGRSGYTPIHGWCETGGKPVHAVVMIGGLEVTLCEIAKIKSMLKGGNR